MLNAILSSLFDFGEEENNKVNNCQRTIVCDCSIPYTKENKTFIFYNHGPEEGSRGTLKVLLLLLLLLFLHSDWRIQKFRRKELLIQSRKSRTEYM